jgi:hypothetical protein
VNFFRRFSKFFSQMQGQQGPLVPGRNRILDKDQDVFSQNAWDNVEMTENEVVVALEKISIQKENSIPLDQHSQYNDDPASVSSESYNC